MTLLSSSHLSSSLFLNLSSLSSAQGAQKQEPMASFTTQKFFKTPWGETLGTISRNPAYSSQPGSPHGSQPQDPLFFSCAWPFEQLLPPQPFLQAATHPPPVPTFLLVVPIPYLLASLPLLPILPLPVLPLLVPPSTRRVFVTPSIRRLASPICTISFTFYSNLTSLCHHGIDKALVQGSCHQQRKALVQGTKPMALVQGTKTQQNREDFCPSHLCFKFEPTNCCQT